MPFDRPTLAALYARIKADIAARLAAPQPPRGPADVLARTEAGAVHDLYGYLGWMAHQIMPDTAEAEHLARWAAVWGVHRRPGAPARGWLRLAGANGVTIPAGITAQTTSGLRFVSTEAVTITSGTALIPLEAEAIGSAGNLPADTPLTLTSAIPLVEGQGVADTAFDGGAEAEADESLRPRVMARIQAPPHGGAAHDYIAWALEVPGVAAAWVAVAEMGIGTVTVRIMAEDGIPGPELLAAVQDHIDAVRPVTAEVFVTAPHPVPLVVEIPTLTPDTLAVRAAIEAELRDLIARTAAPGATLRISHLREAISRAPGEQDHTLAAPLADVPHLPHQIATFGGVVWP